MHSEAQLAMPALEATAQQPGARRGAWLRRLENFLLVGALLAMMLLPLSDMLLRVLLPGNPLVSSVLVQQLTLAVGVIGGAIAARENRLLSLSSILIFLKEPWKARAQFFAAAIAAAVTAFLAVASAQLVVIEKQMGDVITFGIPRWTIQLLLPIGFSVVALRLLWHSASTWTGRAAAVALAAAVAALGIWTLGGQSNLILPALALLLLATICGAPVFVTLGGAALILFWGGGLPITSVAIDHYRLVTDPMLPAIPLFTLAGYFLAEGGASRRLIRLFQALVGWLRGGPAIVTALVCAFFTSFTGASGVTILALGGLMMPVLLAARFSERNALGLLTSAGSLGLLFPPCLPLILYAIVAKVPMNELFLGGLLPGLVLVAATVLWGVSRAPALGADRLRLDGKEIVAALWAAKWEVLIPVLALTTLLTGIATPVEAAALTAAYALFVEAVIYRDLRLTSDVPRTITESGLVVGGILLILGVALGFTNYLVDAQVPFHAVEWATRTIREPWVFLLLLNLFLIVVGCVMDIYSAIIVVVPLIVPLGQAFGIHPIHLGIIFLANLELGYLTPPVGMNLFLSSYRFNKPMSEVTRSVIPMLIVLLIGVLLITYLPFLTTWLPGLFAAKQ